MTKQATETEQPYFNLMELKNKGIEYPLTVITVNYNNDAGLERTMESTVNQSENNFEYIIIDGGSGDKSLKIINRYKKKLSKWISETDEGIFDAMNKGVSIASGYYINFMNSGDLFYDNNVIKKVFKFLHLDYDLIYGDNVIAFNNFGYERYRKAGELKDLWKGLQFSHQSLFTKRSLLLERPFNLNYRSGADTDFVMDCFYNKKVNYLDVGLCISKIEAGGLSDRSIRVKDYFKMRKRYDKMFVYHIPYLFFRLIYMLFIKRLKRIIPGKYLRFLYMLRK